MALPTGKVPSEVLEKVIFRYLGAERRDVVLGPALGEDASIVRVNGRLLAISSDPVSGAVSRIGWFAVHTACNDIATMGVRPLWFLSCIMLPHRAGKRLVQEICRQLDQAASELGVSIIGGHAEVTPGLTHPLIVGSAAGVVECDRYVKTSGCRPRSRIILTKSVGVEGTAILALDRRRQLTRRFGVRLVTRAQCFIRQISVVKDALTAFKFGGVLAMHDPTEGGVAMGLHEMADAAGGGFRVYRDAIPVAHETEAICSFYKVNPLNLISSGVLLISAEPQATPTLAAHLKKRGIPAAIIGEFLDDSTIRVMVERNGVARRLPLPRLDALWGALKRKV